MKLLISTMLISALLSGPAMAQQQPVIADSRIKTFVYNENDVFAMTTHYGYQSNIEFGLKEEIQTVSVGDRYAWQIIPVGRRLFVRAEEENASTNMTVITNKRTYQFDLFSTDGGELPKNRQVAYVVRFYYPDEHSVSAMPAAVTAEQVLSAMQPPPAYNFQYTYTGPDALAPTKIYDDGATTYFRLAEKPGNTPQIFAIGSDGSEQKLLSTPGADGMHAVAGLAPRYAIHYSSGEVVMVYNEALN